MGLTKKEICERSETIAYYSGLCGVEVKQITYGIEDYMYCESGAWGGGKSYHKLKIQTDIKGNMFVKLHGYRLFLDEFIRTGKEQTELWEQ
jgi:hypothetical protein